MKYITSFGFVFVVACGAMNMGNGDNGGGANGGNGGGANGGSGGGASGGSGGGASGGSGGGGGSVQEDSVSGTRIKAKNLTTPDGAKGFFGWFDSQLNVDCYFYPASDGQQRCMPANGASIGSYFAESGCTTPVAFMACSGGTAPSYASAYRASTTCGATAYAYHIYPVMGAFSGQLFSGSPASCTMVNPIAGYSYYSVGSELPPSTFVAATIAVQ